MSKRQMQVHKRRDGLLPYAVIQAATTGDPDAISAILRHYSGYITSMSLRTLYDGQGNSYLCVDEAMRHRLEVKLITGILAFRIA